MTKGHRVLNGYRATALAVGLSVALAACGSTVGPTAPRQPGSGSGPDLSGDVAMEGAGRDPFRSDDSMEMPGLGPTESGPGSSPAGSASTTRRSTSGAPASGAPGSDPGGPSGSAGNGTGPGVTETAIRLGYPTYDENVGTFARAFGVEGLDTGDEDAQTEAVVADIHRRGGLAGRKIELVIHQFNTAQAIFDPNTANQAACATWTEDNDVFAVLNPGGIINEVLLACLKKKNTPLVNAGGIEAPRLYRDDYAKYPDYFNVGAMLGERYDEISIRRLVARDFFESWNTVTGGPGTEPMRVGILGRDSPSGEKRIGSIERQLARYGIEPTSVVRCPDSFSEAIRCQQSSVLRFRSDGITHVVGDFGLFFLETAESQGYRPRYFIATTPRTFEENASPAQLDGAMSESFIPTMDVGHNQDPGDPTPATTHCKRIMEEAGQNYSSRTTLWQMVMTCDSFFFVKAAAEASPALTTAGLRAGFESLGSRVPSALTWSTYFGSGEHASTNALRDMLYTTDCNCWVYTSSTNYGDE